MKTCKICNSNKKYNKKHDAYYCESCDKWLEKNCGDPECDYCRDRPEKPNMLREEEKVV
jgi:hypothetical protein